MPDREHPPRLGVLAFGDSITNAGGELQWGVALQSWALWIARGLGLPYTGYAFDGARVADVVAKQIPLFERLSVHRGARYDVGCLLIGANDVRALEWDAAAFEPGYRAALRFLVSRCDRTLTATAPLKLGWPRAGAKVRELNDVIERAATELGALTVDLRDFGARNHVMVDQVHPTAFGQIAIAQRALEVLARDGLPPRVLPSELIVYERTWLGRLRGDATYAYRWIKLVLKQAFLLARLRLGDGAQVDR